MSSSSLCHLCSQLTVVDLYDNDVKFHPNLSCIQEAATAGCPLCSLIMKRCSMDWTKSVTEALLKGETPKEFEGETFYHQVWLRGEFKPIQYHESRSIKSPVLKNGERIYVSVGKLPPGLGEPDYNEPSIGTNIRLEAFVSESSPLSSTIEGRLFSSKHDQNRYMPFILRSLEECQTYHAECSAGTAGDFMPTRVLEINENGGLKLVYSNGLHESYAALSYCWGPKSPALQLTAQTHEEMLSGCDHAVLSKAHQEAIQITMGLGLRYLWIDALCIIQGDPDDWARESRLMASVYGKAAITIIAGRSNDASLGFIDRNPSDEEDALPQCSILYSPGSEEVVQITSNRGVEFGPTQDRAWCLQEDVLSRRAIVFGENQLIFKCRRSRIYETGERGQASGPTEILRTMSLSQDKKDSPEIRSKVLAGWYDLLKMISQRSISNPHDVFGSIASLAKVVGEILGSRYLAGIWEDDLVRGLLWKPEHHSTMVGNVVTWNSTPVTRPRPTQFAPPPVIRAPTWSWASVQGAVRLWPMGTFRPEGKRPSTFDRGWEDIEYAKIKPILKDGKWTTNTTCGVDALFMPSCQLEVLGHVRKAYVGRYVRIDQKSWRKFPGLQRGKLQYRGLVEKLSEVETMTDTVENPETNVVAFGWFDVPEEACAEVWCLPLTTREGLMLIGHEGKWKRAGVFWLLRRDWFDQVDPGEVLLV